MADAKLVKLMDESIDGRAAVTIRQFRAFVRATGLRRLRREAAS